MTPMAPTVPAKAPAARASIRTASRLAGLGSVFGKTLRDSRAALAGVTVLLCAMVLIGGWTMLTNYGTPAARADLAAISTSMPPILRGMYGNPVAVDTLGGFISWHYGSYFALLGGLWSMLALSSTLAGEARRGSLDLAAVTPLSRQSIALQKVAGHAVALGGAAALVGASTWAAGAWLWKYPGDEVAPAAAAAFAIGFFLRSLVAGSIAFALAPILGRGVAAGIAGLVMVAGYLVYSYRTVVDAFDAIDGLTWFGWASGHLPLVGMDDWPAMGLTALVAAALLVTGVLLFARRDLGVTVALPLPRPPRALLGVRGPVGRAFGELLPAALAWGLGLGLYGLVMAAASRAVADVIATSPELLQVMQGYLPGTDLTTASGMLQFAFVDLGLLLIGLAAATVVASRCSDESAGRLELQLTTPLTRGRWALSSAVAMALGILTIDLVLALAIGAGVAAVGEDPAGAAAGTLVLALYGAALTGIGGAIAGLFGPRWATSAIVGFAILTTLADLLAPALRLDPWVESLALTHYLGRPMLGQWDLTGIAACLVLFAVGALLSAWGMSRRDVGR